ncbi:conjugal transfer protein TrbI [Calothrix membranacea FACHB-236]|nr:conjugal transfer protein TrbI [Calothrix membranacea FACHB-236]
MTRLYRWKTGTAALMAMAITTGAIAPLFASAPASAQYNINQSRTVTIPANVTLPVSYEKEKVIVKPGERMDLTLKIASDIVDNNRNVLIPRGTDVVGRLEPVNLGSVYSNDRNNNNNRQGVRFIAQELVFASGRRQQISANSRTYSQVERISQGSDTGNILTDAAIGAGAATLISLVTGNRKIEVLEPLIGAAAGAGASVLLRKKQADVFVLRPEEDLDITLNSRLLLSRY